MLKFTVLPATLAALLAPAPSIAADPAQEALLQSFRDAGNELAAEALAQWIWVSRNDAVRGGVSPIPAKVRAQLSGHFADALLDKVRYRVGIGDDLALPSHAFRANAAAITLDHVITFRDGRDAATDARLWAHELTHVQQYERWGVRGFARRYTLDHAGVEREAETNAQKIGATLAAR